MQLRAVVPGAGVEPARLAAADFKFPLQRAGSYRFGCPRDVSTAQSITGSPERVAKDHENRPRLKLPGSQRAPPAGSQPLCDAAFPAASPLLHIERPSASDVNANRGP